MKRKAAAAGLLEVRGLVAARPAGRPPALRHQRTVAREGFFDVFVTGEAYEPNGIGNPADDGYPSA